MKNIYLLICLGLIHFIELIQTSPIVQNLDVTSQNGLIDLGEIDTGDEEPSVFIFKRMVETVMADMSGETVSNVSYEFEGVQHQQTTMIIDGKPFVMGAYTVTEPTGWSVMTMYTAGKDGYKPLTKIRYSPKEANKQKLRQSLIGGK